MARQIVVDLVSDTADFERSMKSAGGAVDKFEADLKSADGAASKFDGALEKTTDKLGSATNGFRSTADLAGGLGDVLGISAIGPIASYATGMADIADGMGGLLAPALAKSKAAFAAMNATMLANPIFLVVAALAALTIGFVIAYKKSETFRAIVHKVFDSVKDGAVAFKNAIVNAVTGAAQKIATIADIITTPYQIAFRAIASLWNNTVGRLSFSIPGWVPGIGGAGFDVPDIPMLAKGGIVNKPTLAMIGEAGPEAVVPLSGRRGAGMGTTVNVVISTGASDLDELIRKRVKVLAGGNVQKAFGTPS